MRKNNTQKTMRHNENSILGKRGKGRKCLKSYSRDMGLRIVCLATSLAGMILAGCSKGGGTPSFKTGGEAVTECKAFLSSLRKEEAATIERLASSVNEWRVLNDSATACLDRDTTTQGHAYPKAEYRQVKDSVIAEFCRLAQSKERSYRDLFYLKEQTSSFNDDKELKEAVKSAQPFFASLDTVTINIRGGKEAVMARYRTFLKICASRAQSNSFELPRRSQIYAKSSLARGIRDKSCLLSFITDEHRHFMAFLKFLPDFADCGMTDIMRDTESCYSAVLKSAGNGGLSSKDAVVYLTMRTNKRLIANAKAALADIMGGKVRDGECARAYTWMLIQPFMATDGFSVATLSDSEKTTMYGIADALPKAFQRLECLLGDGKERLPEMPALLMKIYLARL